MGALDMGGASTQITFVPGGPVQDERTQATFRLYGFEHSIYTHSHLCFGRDEALSRLLARLVQVGSPRGGAGGRAPSLEVLTAPRPSPQSRPSLLVRHPCYHSGYRGTVSLARLFESPCVQATAPPHLPPNLTVEGTGNPRACVSAIQELFNFSSCEGRGDCAFNGVYQPPVRGQFYVSPWGRTPGGPGTLRLARGRAETSAAPAPTHPCPRTGFLQLLLHLPLPKPHLGAAAGHRQRHRLGVLPEALEAGGWAPGPLIGAGMGDPTPDSVTTGLGKLWKGGQPLGLRRDGPRRPRRRGFTWLPASPAQVEEASAGQDGRLRDYCASGLYILTLLVDGYGFSEHTWPSIEFRKQVAPSRAQGGRGGGGGGRPQP